MTPPVRTIAVNKTDRRITQGPLVRVVLDGEGCDIPNCDCSNGNFILVSDGDTLLACNLTPDQAAALRLDGRLEASSSS